MLFLRVGRCLRRDFHAGPTFFGINYRNAEDEHFRSVFVQLPSSSTKIGELLKNGGPQNLPNYDLLLKNRNNLKLGELIDVVRSLEEVKQTGSVKSRKFTTLWNAVDVAMERQISPSVDTQQIMDILLAWNELGFSRISRSAKIAVELLSSRFHSLAPDEAHFWLFAVVAARKWPSSLQLAAVEEKLRDMASRTKDGRVLGLISAAYFKTRTVCEDLRLVDDVVSRTSELINAGVEVDDISLCSVSKFAGFVANKRVWRTGPLSVLSLVQACAKNLEKMSLLACVHLLEASAQQKISPDEFFEGVRRRICEAKFDDGFRLKELERFLLAFDQVGPEFEQMDELVEKLKQMPHGDRRRYLHSFQVCVRMFATHGRFLDDEIGFCLEESSVKDLTDDEHYPDALRELWELDSLVELGHPDYRGPRLKPELVDLAVKKYARRKSIVDSTSKDNLFPGEKVLYEALVFIRSRLKKKSTAGWSEQSIFYPLPFLSIPCILLRRNSSGILEPAPAVDCLGARGSASASPGSRISAIPLHPSVPPWRASPTSESLWKNGVVLVPVQPRYLVRNHHDRLTGRLRLFSKLMKLSGAEVVLLSGELVSRNAMLRAVLGG